MRPGHDAPVFNPLPWIVWVLALPVIAAELFFALGQSGIIGGPQAIGWRLDAVNLFGFAPDFQRGLVARGMWLDQGWLRLLTYPVAHLSFTDALFSVVILLAIGNLIGRVFSPVAMVILYFGSSVATAALYTLMGFDAPLVGADVAVYGLIGAFTWMRWAQYPAGHPERYQAFTLAGFLIGLRVFFWWVFGGSMAWVAAVLAVPVGFGLAILCAPGGLARVLNRMRQR
ncbi:rhomboid family intramembrane serine protease [Aliigemmobacter aestuarii]|uniref:Rhomboid family intramembrane serine protease n=1 Tax=Aliigemmobacter aestuarii TaxID=1445661 RepID=A0A4S3MRZ0_9RHOB|nr:rhomboid family intramembrane serine protease [Gemmobacter aestuarii]THD84894.1 rhomboid family intramembrane serine protease [Gemmobacter aestuarii]